MQGKMHQKYKAFFYLFKKYNLTSLCLDFFCAAIADRARSFVGQRFSYMLRGHAIIAKTWLPENTNRKQKPKPQKKQKDPAKEVPRKLGEKVKLTRPKPLPSAVLLKEKVTSHSIFLSVRQLARLKIQVQIIHIKLPQMPSSNK